MELFLVSIICSYQSFAGTACNGVAGAYWEQVQGQKLVDKAVDMYVDPYVNRAPAAVRSAGVLGYALYTKHMRIGLYRGLSYDIRETDTVDHTGYINVTTVNYLSYSRSF